MAFKVNLNRVHRLKSYPFLLISNVPSPGSKCFAKHFSRERNIQENKQAKNKQKRKKVW